ncbi:hypothetical protein ACLB2K_052126 [Fragaria x ananassa]
MRYSEFCKLKMQFLAPVVRFSLPAAELRMSATIFWAVLRPLKETLRASWRVWRGQGSEGRSWVLFDKEALQVSGKRVALQACSIGDEAASLESERKRVAEERVRERVRVREEKKTGMPLTPQSNCNVLRFDCS